MVNLVIPNFGQLGVNQILVNLGRSQFGSNWDDPNLGQIGIPWEYFRDILGIPWGYLWDTLKNCLRYIGNKLPVLGDIFIIPWEYFVMGIQMGYLGNTGDTFRIQCRFFVNNLVIPWGYFEDTLKIL